MKKLIFSAAILASAFFAASCQQEMLDPQAEGTTVTYTVEVPNAIATKAIGDQITDVDKVYFEVYRAAEVDDLTKDPVYAGNKPVTNNVASFDLEFIKGQEFVVLFWAQNSALVNTDVNSATGMYNINDLRAIKLVNPGAANNAAAQVFAGKDTVDDCVSDANGNVTLTRPVSQINVYTTTESLTFGDVTIVLDKSSMTVAGFYNTFNVATGDAVVSDENKATFVYTEAAVPAIAADNTAYTYVAMNYVGFAPQAGATTTVDFTIKTTTEAEPIVHKVSNVPVKPNYRTNIVGDLITANADYTVTLDDAWGDDGKSMEVIYEGLVKNINGDYEVATAKGLAYAINNLWAEGGNFYLTAAEYDMTGLNVTAPTIPSGVTLNIYGETPVVTRAMTSIAGITIKGLDSIIETIADGANVSISGVELVDEDSVLVENNSGILVVSESTGEENVVRNGNAPVQADNVKDLATLNAALASDVKTINITESFAADDVVLVGRSVVINGNGKTFTTSATRAFRLTTTGIEVIFNDLKIVSEAVLVGDSVRGVSIDNVNNITLTLNNSSHDFTDPSANDNAYAVNVTGGTNHKVTINRGKYEGANVVNVWGKNHTITIDGAVLTSLYQPSSAYYGFCVSLQEAENSKATIKNSTLNSVHAKAFGGTTKNEFVLENNTDNTQVYPFYIENNPYLTLNEAFAAAENNATIYAPFNAEIASSTVPEGKKVTLVLQNQATKYNTQLTGVDNLTGSFGLINVNPGADLTITGPGSIKLSATNNRGWNAYSSVVSNQRGTLTVNGDAVIEHLGGTDMAYGIDNLTNGKGTKATTTVDGATVKSTYRAIRQFLNGTEATNDLTVKAGSVVEGANKSIWMQDPSANLNTGKLVVEEGAELNGDVYLFVTAGSEAWPVEVSIADSALAGESTVKTGNVPAGYSVENVGGVWKVIAWTSVSTADELVAALEANQSVVFANDIKIDPANMSNAYGKTGINVKNGQAIDGNGYTLNIKGAGGTWDSGINTTGGLIKNLTVTGSFRGIFINHNSDHSEKVVLENVTITGTTYTISCDQGKYQGIEATNCTFNGWTSFAKTAGEAKFVKCTFGEGNGYKYCRPYSKTEFVECTFCPGYTVDTTQAEVTFTNCINQ